MLGIQFFPTQIFDENIRISISFCYARLSWHGDVCKTNLVFNIWIVTSVLSRAPSYFSQTSYRGILKRGFRKKDELILNLGSGDDEFSIGTY